MRRYAARALRLITDLAFLLRGTLRLLQFHLLSPIAGTTVMLVETHFPIATHRY